MPTAAPAKPKPETWLDLLARERAPAPETASLLTREEVIDQLQAQGIDVNKVALVYWEKSGILPRAVRRWRDGAPRALYPAWALPVISTVRGLQGTSSLTELAPKIRELASAHARGAINWADPLMVPIARAHLALNDLARAYGVGDWDAGGEIAGVRVQFFDGSGNDLPGARHEFFILPEESPLSGN